MCLFLHVPSSRNVLRLIVSIIQLLFQLTTMHLIGKNIQNNKKKNQN